ncbi:hypothetical protein [Pseudoduganella chitinolytica]|uniref:Uncharacterized protein n=1 Tax=Pseudoduganella chitinolytica TaxID=34070 RepID=A0ABY8B4P1_9BURK|nr:hypothetical protein [Pseudoduganella chitinolytica]WEF30716.1 hypothetical protein PX653_14655 [Pseudoduganella chitinolytica]
MKFDNFTLSDLAEIKQRTVQRLRAQETLRKAAEHEPAKPGSTLPGLDTIRTYFSGDRSAEDVRQSINRAFAENPRVLALSRADMRETLRSASKKISRE